jgi:hypothetical protein
LFSTSGMVPSLVNPMIDGRAGAGQAQMRRVGKVAGPERVRWRAHHSNSAFG